MHNHTKQMLLGRPAFVSPSCSWLCCLQKHNEQKLCEAFEQSKDVFLIFSVNMSGHFQGYARMVSTSNSRQVLPAVPQTHASQVMLPLILIVGSLCRATHLLQLLVVYVLVAFIVLI